MNGYVYRSVGARVAVLGAYGSVGRHVLAAAARRGSVTTAVGRDGQRLLGTLADAHEVAGVGEAEAMRGIARRHDVVVNATGVESPELAELVTDAGAAFVDLSADDAYLRALARLRPAAPVLAGTGLAPGLTNVLADAVPGTGPLQIGIVAGVGAEPGAAGRDWIWRTAGDRMGSDTSQVVYRAARRFHLPGLGRRTLLRAAFGEQVQLSRTSGRDVTSWLGLDPPLATSVLRLAGAAPGIARHLDRLSGPLARLNRSRDRWVVVVVHDGATVAWASGTDQAVATAAMVSLSVGPVLAADPGVWAAHELLGLDAIVPALKTEGISAGTASSMPVR